MLLSPLEQFEIGVFFLMGQVYVSVLHMFVFFILFVFFLINFILKELFVISNNFILFFKQLYLFVLSLVSQQIGVKGLKFFPSFFFIFFFVVGLNVLGLLPFSFTSTGHLVVTFFLGFSLNLGFLFYGLFLHNLKFFALFVPSGVPSFLLPLIVGIEFFSYLIRTFSLSIRLFVNMMAGHCLLFVVSSFVYGMLSVSYVFIVVISFIYLALFGLELAIAFLQAFVFTILGCIYLSDSIHLGGH